jgi:hypothetical protein
MAKTPTNASTEIFSIVSLEMTSEDIANFKLHERYNSSYSAEVVNGGEQENFSNDSSEVDQQHPATIMQDIHELNNTSFNSTVEKEHAPDKTHTLSKWTDTKTPEASSLVLHELNHSSAYTTINPSRPKSKLKSLPLIHRLNKTSNDNTGKAQLHITMRLKNEFEIYFASTGKAEETNMIRDVDKPGVYFESNTNEAEMGENAESRKSNNAEKLSTRDLAYNETAEKNKAEEVRLHGSSSRGLYGDSEKTRKPYEVEHTRGDSKKKKNATNLSKKEIEETKSANEKNSKLDASHSLAKNSSRDESKDSKKPKRVLSSPWILILTILFLFIIACIILAVLR